MIELTTTKGALDDAAKQRLTGELSTIAAGSRAEAARTRWSKHTGFGSTCAKITDGHWAGFGEVVTLPEFAAYGLNTDEPESKIERMRQAAMESVGAVSTA